MLIDYKEYCESVLLTEEKLKDVIGRLKVVFPEEAEFAIYTSILELFPSLAAKSIVTSVLIRTKEERKKANIGPQDTKHVFEQLLELIRRNIRVDLSEMLKQDKIAHPDASDSRLFVQLTELVHYQIGRIQATAQKKLQKKSGVGDVGEELETKFPDPIYVDDNFEVYEAKSPAECKNYMGDSGICLKTPAHFWGTYRIPYASAIYYIFPRTPKSAYMDQHGGRHRFLQIELRVKGDLMWTWENNNPNHLRSLDELKRAFPELSLLVDKNIFKIRPHSPGEVENYEKVQDELDDASFKKLGYEVRTMYIANGHKLTDGQWSMIDRDQKNAYVNFSLNRDVTKHQFEDIKKDPALYKRYVVIKKRGLEAKIKSGEFLNVGATPHETIVLPELLTNASESTKKTVVNGLIANLKDVLSGKVIPKTDILGVYNLFKGQLLSDPAIQEDGFIKSIAEILAGTKAFAWQTVDDTVKKGVHQVAYDIYTANAAKLKPIIDAKIKSDPPILLQGLTRVPTKFQVEFFDEHRKELLASDEFKKVLDDAILSNLIYGTVLPDWLRQFWNENKKDYTKDPNFIEKIKFNLRNAIFSKSGSKFPGHNELPLETREIYDAYIDQIWNEPDTLEIVKNTFYDLTATQKNDPERIKEWPVSDDFKEYFIEHKKELEAWLVYRLINAPIGDLSPFLSKMVQEYKGIVFNNPKYRDEIEKKLISDIVSSSGVMFGWTTDRLKYWVQNFWDILKRHPGLEEQLVQRVIREYGTDKTANSFYSEYGIPYEFYKKHEKEILSDPKAYIGLKEKVVEALRWRDDKNQSTEEAMKVHLSKIEQDFLLNHRKDIPDNILSPDLRGT